MSDLSRVKIKFLEEMGITRHNEMFFDEDNGRVFLFTKRYKQNFGESDHICKEAVLRTSKDKALVLMKRYSSTVYGSLPESRIARVMKDNLWCNFVENIQRIGYVISAQSVDENYQLEESYPYETDTNRLSFTVNDDKLATYISKAGPQIPIVVICSLNTITVINRDGSSEEPQEFNAESYEAILRKYLSEFSNEAVRETFTNLIPFICNTVIPAVLSRKIAQTTEVINSYSCHGDCDGCRSCDDKKDENSKLSQIRAVFEEYARNKGNQRGAKQKRLDEGIK